MFNFPFRVLNAVFINGLIQYNSFDNFENRQTQIKTSRLPRFPLVNICSNVKNNTQSRHNNQVVSMQFSTCNLTPERPKVMLSIHTIQTPRFKPEAIFKVNVSHQLSAWKQFLLIYSAWAKESTFPNHALMASDEIYHHNPHTALCHWSPPCGNTITEESGPVRQSGAL